MFEEILDNIKTEATTVGAQKRFQLKQRAKTIEELQQRAGKIKGSESISNLLTKKDKMGRPYLSDYMEKLNALEDLQTNQYINPKTNKPFTPKEWLAVPATTRSKARDPETFKSKKAEYQKQYMKARKKADPKFAEMQKDIRKKEYFEKATKKTSPIGKGKGVLLLENNRLLQYMNTAYKKQNKNLKGTDKIPEFEEIFEKGKFVGMRDNKAGINYYHAGYKGELGPKSKLITSHPDYKNLKKLTRLASEFNKSMPNKTIASYFDAYDRVPTTGELANFLTRDKKYISKYSKQAMSTNPLEVHHTLGVEKKPTKGLQLTLRDRNNAAGSVVDQFNNGSLTKQEATQQLKKLNVRYKLPGTKEYIGAKAISPEQSVKTAKQRVTKLFNQRLRENPKLAEDIAKRFNITKGGQIVLTSGVDVTQINKLFPEVGNFIKSFGGDVGQLFKKFGASKMGKVFAAIGAPLEVGFIALDVQPGLRGDIEGIKRNFAESYDFVPGVSKAIGAKEYREELASKTDDPNILTGISQFEEQKKYNDLRNESLKLIEEINQATQGGRLSPSGINLQKLERLQVIDNEMRNIISKSKQFDPSQKGIDAIRDALYKMNVERTAEQKQKMFTGPRGSSQNPYYTSPLLDLPGQYQPGVYQQAVDQLGQDFAQDISSELAEEMKKQQLPLGYYRDPKNLPEIQKTILDRTYPARYGTFKDGGLAALDEYKDYDRS